MDFCDLALSFQGTLNSMNSFFFCQKKEKLQELTQKLTAASRSWRLLTHNNAADFDGGGQTCDDTMTGFNGGKLMHAYIKTITLLSYWFTVQNPHALPRNVSVYSAVFTGL